MLFFLFHYVWLVVGLCVVFRLPDCGSVLSFVCVCLYVFLLLRA